MAKEHKDLRQRPTAETARGDDLLSLPTSIRQINELRILRALRAQPGISRSAIARRTGLGKATVSTLVQKLVRSGVILENAVGAASRTAGRRPLGLQFSPASRLTIGAVFTGGDCVAVLCDLHGRVLRTVTTAMTATTVHRARAALRRVVRTLVVEEDELIGIGIGIPGLVDATHRHVVVAENLGWRDVPLAEMVRKDTGVPTRLENRSNAGALAEHRVGAARGAACLVYVSAGTGIGAGIIIDGALWRGASSSAGELGHTTIQPAGPLCSCGRRGCLEAIASFSAVARSITGSRLHVAPTRPKDPRAESGLDVGALVAAREPRALAALETAASALGSALGATVNLLNPDMILIELPLPASDASCFVNRVGAALQEHCIDTSFASLTLMPASLGHLGSAIGAAELAIDDAFSSGRVLDACRPGEESASR